jgi:hypothetical protein
MRIYTIDLSRLDVRPYDNATGAKIYGAPRGLFVCNLILFSHLVAMKNYLLSSAALVEFIH